MEEHGLIPAPKHRWLPQSSRTRIKAAASIAATVLAIGTGWAWVHYGSYIPSDVKTLAIYATAIAIGFFAWLLNRPTDTT